METPRTTVGRTHVDSIHEIEDVTINIAFNPCRSHGDSNSGRKMDLDHILKRKCLDGRAESPPSIFEFSFTIRLDNRIVKRFTKKVLVEP